MRPLLRSPILCLPARLGLLALALVVGACATARTEPQPGRPVRMPARLEGGLFLVQPVTASGERLNLGTNTGSGPVTLDRAVARRLELAEDSLLVKASLPDQPPVRVHLVPFPAFRPSAWIPAPLVDYPGRFLVSEPSREPARYDAGYLGPGWFARRTWTLDYPRGQLLLRAPGDLPQAPGAHTVRLGFKTDAEGRRVEWHPRIRVQIGGDSVDLLLATGANEILSETAMRALGVRDPGPQAISIVSEELFERWRARHPEWRVVEGAVDDGDNPVIEVPEVSVAGHTVGPVWFAASYEGGFYSDWLSRWTDLPLQGALGGNALRFFRLTVDFDRGVAVFERP